ncbi:MAG TPA: hypothetical protein VMV49_17460 [Candidatus Deferrimicrobium sp.]|nr:hypothetical protein [Candidatus Deferrimicrobium sp.]
MDKVGFLRFELNLFNTLIEIAAEKNFTKLQIIDAILDITKYINQLLKLPENSETYEIHIIEYKEFEALYRSIHDEIPLHKLPIYLVAGFVNLKDKEIPGYVSFSLPRTYVEHQNRDYNLKELLVNAAHERFERFLLKETILAKIYDKAREDYHEEYTLNKEKNIEAIMLYSLNKDLIPLQETITYAMNHLVNEFIENHYEPFNTLLLPLINREFTEEDESATDNFALRQFKNAQIHYVGKELAYKRLLTGLNILELITIKFPELCTDFANLYPTIKSQSNERNYSISQVIENTIQIVRENHRLSDILTLFDQELATL